MATGRTPDVVVDATSASNNLRKFVDRPAPQLRLNQRGAPHYGHLPAAGGGLGLGDRAVEPVTHESEGQPRALFGMLSGWVPGEHEDRHLIFVLPGIAVRVTGHLKGPATHQHRASRTL